MNTKTKKQITRLKTYTVGQYLEQVIEHRKIFETGVPYCLKIEPKDLAMFKPENINEQEFFNLVVNAYIEHCASIRENIWDAKCDFEYIRNVRRTINRLIDFLVRHSNKQKLLDSPEWKFQFYTRRYGIDIQRQRAAERKKQNKKPVVIKQTEKKTARDLLCIAYELDNTKSCKQNAFFSFEDFSFWLSSKNIKGKDIRLQTIVEAKLIDDTLVNSDDAIEYITRTLEQNKTPIP
jgi:hypothetical protein